MNKYKSWEELTGKEMGQVLQHFENCRDLCKHSKRCQTPKGFYMAHNEEDFKFLRSDE